MVMAKTSWGQTSRHMPQPIHLFLSNFIFATSFIYCKDIFIPPHHHINTSMINNNRPTIEVTAIAETVRTVSLNTPDKDV